MPSIKSPAPWVNVGKASKPDDAAARVCRFCGKPAECSVQIRLGMPGGKGFYEYLPACRPCKHEKERIGMEVEE